MVNMATIPSKFVDLSTAYHAAEQSMQNVIGIVVDILSPTVTRTGDHMVTFKLMDPSIRDGSYDNNGQPIKGLKVRFFRRSADQLPRVKQQGDIMIIWNIKMSSYFGQPMAISNRETSAVVYPITTIPDSNSAMVYKPMECLGFQSDVMSVEEPQRQYVVQLKRDMRSTFEELPPASSAAAKTTYKYPSDEPSAARPATKSYTSALFGRKFALVKDLRHRDFADICVEVVKSFPGQYGVELYVTDYTENKEMFFYAPPEMSTDERDGDDYGYTGSKKQWPGPFGHLALKVNTRGPHSSYASKNVNEGDIVLLKNVKMKIMADGAKLEGDMWPDDRNPEKVQIEKSQRVTTSQEVDEIEKRKERYWSARQAKEDESKKLSKTEKKKIKKQQKKAAAAASVAQREAQPALPTTTSKNDLNPHIRCSYPEVSIRSISTILDPENKLHTCKMPNGKTQIMPFVNAKYRTRVRVIDYMPKQIEDFTMPTDDPALGQAVNPDSSQTHEWSFALLLEDANKPKAAINADSDTMWVTLHHEEVQHLFGNHVGDPTDLRKDAALLAKVKQQLFLLWGNLEEKKDDEDVSNRPFECCLMEYGVELDDNDPAKATTPLGYMRMYAMFGTTIL